MLDAGGRILDMDSAFRSLTRAAPLPGRRLAQLLDWIPDTQPKAEVSVRHESIGGELEVMIRPLSPHLAPVCFTVTVRRVRTRQETLLTRQLQIARQTFDAFVDSSPVTILTLDPEMRVTMWNRAAEQMFGWTADEILGRPYPLVPTDEWKDFEKLYERVLDGKGFTGVEAWRKRKDGSPIRLRMHTAPMADGEGGVSGAMAILEDLTERDQLENQVRHSQKMEAVGRLAGGIAHDFNNLLTVIMGMCDLMELEDELAEQAFERVSEIRRVSDTARELVAQLMTFSRRQVMRGQIFDLNEHIRNSVRMLGRLISERIELALCLWESPLWIKTDPNQLDQILINLVVNASDAMPQGGRIELRTSQGRAPERLDSASEHHVLLEVADTGTGIPEDVLPHIFDPFFTTKKAGSGTGLGLANVYGIVEQSKGHVTVDSALGHGTCFCVFLPQQAAPRVVAGVGVGAAGEGGSERVLLVEDNDAVRRSTAKLLESMGYAVEVARDGAEAVEAFEGGLRVDLVLSDLSMPRMTGAELADYVREHYPELAIVLMSGNLDVADLKEEVEAGRMAFMQKPISLRSLSKTLRVALDGRGRQPSQLAG
ncbi:Multi-sensor Hybrid Histidine Kinase [Plesiocystis pacifica SIR-1]|uniref:histidine kinase n=1 Tax=Plesiocystis pacifica SIR-1 TaxID=391625 RepID=A6G1U5_9BACT|nr:Multi-sensor Hybrid Histidine Kinase [Plesiocystis pacifica SIR-1]